MIDGEKKDLCLEGVYKAYGGKPVLEGLDLSLKAGVFHTVFGVSGSGKSTLLKVIAGIEKPEMGEVLLGDRVLTHLLPEKRGLGMVFQSPHLFPHLSVRENVSFGLKVRRLDQSVIKTQTDEILSLLDIHDFGNRMPHELSGGQQQRVAIARAVITSPKVLLMDEPFSGLDHNLRLEMGGVIKGLQERLKMTVVFVTHDVEECLRLSDHVAVLHGGRILQKGAPEDIYHKPQNQTVERLFGPSHRVMGRVEKGVFKCALGDFKVGSYADGMYEWLVRPHQLRVSSSKKSAWLQMHLTQIENF